jgi:phospholipid/cholesterol/gamma-HCH transport system permease protein
VPRAPKEAGPANVESNDGDTPTAMQLAVENGASVLYLSGRWRLSNIAALTDALRDLELGRGTGCVLDGSRLAELDTSAAFLLLHRLSEGGAMESMVATRAMSDSHLRLFELVRDRMHAAPAEAKATRLGPLGKVGAVTLAILHEMGLHNAFTGQVSLEIVAIFRRPMLFRPKETVAQFQSVTVDAIPIVALVTFLIGVVFAYLLGVQAQHYGATIFVVDGVGIAICRELSPILVAVIVAGRSGAAFTAQIGAMKVQEETDAISTLGLSPIQVLVIPRLVAIVAGLPLLVFVGDLAGIGGGIVISSLLLDISPATFANRLHAVLPMSAFVVGVAKAPVFAAFIATIACRMGMSVELDARSVGEHTTSTVVQSIVWVIVLDAVFAVVLQRLGI